MKLITHSQRSWKYLLRCGATATCLGLALAGYAQTSGSSASPSNDRENRNADKRDATSSSYANRDNDKFAKADQKFIRKMTETSQREMAIAQLGVERATNPQVKAFAQKMVTDHQTLDREFASVSAAVGGASTTAMRGSSESIDTSTGTSATSIASGAGTTGAAGTRTDPAHKVPSTTGTSTTSGQTGSMAASTGSSGATSATGATASDYSRDHSAMSRSGSHDRVVRKLMDEKSGTDFDKAFVKAMVKEHKHAEDLLEDAAEDDDHSEQIRSFANKNLPTIRAHLAEAQQLEKSID